MSRVLIPDEVSSFNSLIKSVAKNITEYYTKQCHNNRPFSKMAATDLNELKFN